MRGQTATEYKQRAEQTENWPKVAVRAKHGMVATDEEPGSQAGVEILKRGGNAIDAGVAVAFALAVVEPAAGNIGGGGFMLVRLAGGKTTFFDYREVAPGAATRDMYVGTDGKLVKDASTVGFRSVAVPGTVAGLELVLKTYGTMKLADVMAPAIRLAEQGFPVSEALAKELVEEQEDLQKFPVSWRIFLHDGKLWRAGETLKQPELAATLKRIAAKGAEEFYRGETARMLVEDMKRGGGLITMKDLASYTPKVREALHANYQSDGHSWDGADFTAAEFGWSGDHRSAEHAAECATEGLGRRRERAHGGGDDAACVCGSRGVSRRSRFRGCAGGGANRSLLREGNRGDDRSAARGFEQSGACGNAAQRAEQRRRQAGTPEMIVSLGEGPHTTHFSVVDGAGNAVASTYTLNNGYGSHVTSSAGFLLNDEMDDFTTQPGVPNALFGLIQSEANAIAPGHRPLSSMTPTILLRDGQLSFVTGSPGGPTIISATLLSVINWMRLGMDAQAAINAPRFHHQWLPDQILMEKNFPESMEQALQARGFATKRRGHIGLVNAIGIDPTTSDRLGAADPRDEGSAVGY